MSEKVERLTETLPQDGIERGAMLHRLLVGKRSLLPEVLEHYKLTKEQICEAIESYIIAQDIWMQENVATLVMLMIRNQGRMNAEPVMKYLETIPGKKVESSTAFRLLRAEIHGLGYDAEKTFEKGILSK